MFLITLTKVTTHPSVEDIEQILADDKLYSGKLSHILGQTFHLPPLTEWDFIEQDDESSHYCYSQMEDGCGYSDQNSNYQSDYDLLVSYITGKPVNKGGRPCA